MDNINHLISVGIDLTSSEKKHSGWAVVSKNVASTCRIRTDLELIDLTISQNPAVIVLDAPLSLPTGRLSVFDTDPGRQQFGITRECERALLKVGIRSYPCLIPSMQRLTERGIRLAAEFRSQGFEVIEGYPGGAQDILGIPRKQKGILELAKGIERFGITGSFVEKPISHDELDAITVAIVGCFYLSGSFEAFGNDSEGFLIVPKL